MNISFEDGTSLRSRGRLNLTSMDYLQSIRLEYHCEWPIEILIDEQTVQRKYNRVFKLLVRIKYAKYLMEKRDYHLREPNLLRRTSSYTYAKNFAAELEDMGARERLLLQNQVMLGQLMH